MAFKMKAGKEGPMMKNFPAAFKVEEESMYTTKNVGEGGTRIPAVNIEEKKSKKIKVLTTLKPNFVEYKGKYYRSKMGKGFVPGGGSEPVSKQEAFNSKMVTPDELKQIRSKRKIKEN